MSEFDLSTMRHSAAHVMAAAIQKLYPEAKFDIGPSTEEGFYYDVDLPKRLVPEDLKEIEKVMKKMLGQRLPFTRKEVSREEAKALFESHPEGYYDAILMDMRMPEMDGLTATRAIRAMDRADSKVIPIIALTANAFDEDVQRSMQAGLNAHLSKPVEPEALYETLESLIKP